MRIHVLDVPFEERQLASAARARWNESLRAWVVFTRSDVPLTSELAPYAAPRFSWPAWQEDAVNGSTHQALPGEGIVLHAHQVEAADLIENSWLAGRPGVLLADEVGLGKTFSALAGVNRLKGPLNVLVLCPLSVVPHWRRSIRSLGSEHRFCVVNYDRAKTLLEVPQSARTAKRTRTRNQRTATKGVSRVAWDVIIADEAHLMKNPTSQRAAAVRQLQSGKKEGSFMIWCSATAGQNPVELSYAHRLIASVAGTKASTGLDDFAAWCQSLGLKVRKSFGGLVWDANDDDLDRMRTLLFSGSLPAALRRRPSDVSGWPELERIAWPVELSPTDRAIYEDSWEKVRQVVLADQDRRRRGERPTRRNSSDPTNPLVALLRFRQKASGLRIDSTVDFVETLLDNDRQVAVSVEFRDVTDALVERLRKRGFDAAVIHGGQSPAEREENRLRFQRGDVRVVVFTVREGISLHAGELSSAATTTPRVTVVHDPRWDAISAAQIEGRTWRDGQQSTCYHAFAEGTVEEKVVAAMLGKLEAMKTMFADSDRDDVLELLESVVGTS